MKIDRVILNDRYTLERIVKALTNRLSAEDNFQMKLLTVASPAGANTEFTVNHNLGKIPAFYVWNVNANAVIYDSRRNQWTTTQMFLKCSGTTVSVVLLIM